MIGEIALWVHIAAGVCGLALGPLAIREGVRAAAHARPAAAYHCLVAIVSVSALALALLDLSRLWFFVPIAVGTYGFALAAHLAARRRSGRWRQAYVRGVAGAYISLVTAVLVVSVSALPLVWLLPTVIGAPLIERLCQKIEAPLTAI